MSKNVHRPGGMGKLLLYLSKCDQLWIVLVQPTPCCSKCFTLRGVFYEMLKNFIIVIFSQKKTLNYTSIESISSSIKLTARQSLCCIMVVENMKAPASANEKGIAAGQGPTLAVLFSFLCGSNIYNL